MTKQKIRKNTKKKGRKMKGGGDCEEDKVCVINSGWGVGSADYYCCPYTPLDADSQQRVPDVTFDGCNKSDDKFCGQEDQKLPTIEEFNIENLRRINEKNNNLTRSIIKAGTEMATKFKEKPLVIDGLKLSGKKTGCWELRRFEFIKASKEPEEDASVDRIEYGKIEPIHNQSYGIKKPITNIKRITLTDDGMMTITVTNRVYRLQIIETSSVHAILLDPQYIKNAQRFGSQARGAAQKAPVDFVERRHEDPIYNIVQGFRNEFPKYFTTSCENPNLCLTVAKKQELIKNCLLLLKPEISKQFETLYTEMLKSIGNNSPLANVINCYLDGTRELCGWKNLQGAGSFVPEFNLKYTINITILRLICIILHIPTLSVDPEENKPLTLNIFKSALKEFINKCEIHFPVNQFITNNKIIMLINDNLADTKSEIFKFINYLIEVIDNESFDKDINLNVALEPIIKPGMLAPKITEFFVTELNVLFFTY